MKYILLKTRVWSSYRCVLFPRDKLMFVLHETNNLFIRSATTQSLLFCVYVGLSRRGSVGLSLAVGHIILTDIIHTALVITGKDG